MEFDDTDAATKGHAIALQAIWEKVSDRIIERMFDLTGDRIDVLHVNLRPEMILAIAKLRLGICSSVAQIRRCNRDLSDIDIAVEEAQCFDSIGVGRIEASARNCAASWLRRYRKRWKPRSLTALEREKNPPKLKPRAPKPVEKNHFIGKAFIRRYWATNGMIKIWRKLPTGAFARGELEPYGKWGHRKNLYSDQLEDYFGLVEGDAAQPLEMLLSGEPLNEPQREASIGFFVIQMLRNPTFLGRIEAGMKAIVASSVGTRESQDDDYMRAVRESLFHNNDFYNRVASPVLWNTWVIVKSEAAFILPDNWGILRSEPETDSLFCVPITPSRCFISLPPRERQKRVVPIAISADAERASQINRLLITESTNEFISDVNVGSCSEVIGEQGSLLDWIRAEIQRVNSDVGEWT